MNNRREFIKKGAALAGGLAAGLGKAYSEKPAGIWAPQGQKGNAPLVNCYYYAPHNHSLLARHIEYDLENDSHEMNNLVENPHFKSVVKRLKNQPIQAEQEANCSESEFYPEVPISVEILDWVKYKHRNDYLEMLEGKEIGFQKFQKKFKNEYGY